MTTKIRNCSICLRNLSTRLLSFDWGEWTCKTIYEATTDEEKKNAKICHKIDSEFHKSTGR